MSKLTLITMVLAATSFVTPIAFAEETGEKRPPAAEAETVAETEEEEPQIFEAGFDFDFFSAYVWRNAVQNDEMVMQPCVWADLTYFEPFWFGFYIWQNFDLTDRRRSVFKQALDETDYNLHVGATVWETEDEEYSLDVEAGHEWYTYNDRRNGVKDGFPDTREVYVKTTFDNPFVGVYGQISWMYDDFGDYRKSCYYELGFNKEIELIESLTLGADWNVGFGDSRYNEFLYGYSRSGFGGTTVKAYLTWQVTDWMSLGGVIAYTGVLNPDLRDDIDEEVGNDYPRDQLWGGVQLKLAF